MFSPTKRAASLSRFLTVMGRYPVNPLTVAFAFLMRISVKLSYTNGMSEYGLHFGSCFLLPWEKRWEISVLY